KIRITTIRPQAIEIISKMDPRISKDSNDSALTNSYFSKKYFRKREISKRIKGITNRLMYFIKITCFLGLKLSGFEMQIALRKWDFHAMLPEFVIDGIPYFAFGMFYQKRFPHPKEYLKIERGIAKIAEPHKRLGLRRYAFYS